MPKYRIEALSFIDNRLVQPGTEIESDQTPAEHWTPLDKPAKAEAKAAKEAVNPVADLAALSSAAAATGVPDVALPVTEAKTAPHPADATGLV